MIGTLDPRLATAAGRVARSRSVMPAAGLDDPAVNAFAMPGGYIYVTRGILAHLNSEAQLAGVLGHEIGHVTHRHSAEQLTRQQVAGIGLGVASLMSEAVSKYGGMAQQAL